MAPWLLFMVLALVACEEASSPRARAPAAAPDPTLPIERVPWRPNPDAEPRAYDCTMVPALARYFAGTRVENCGVLDLDASDADEARAKSCVASAVAAKRNVLFVQQVHGTDSGVRRGFVARREGNEYVAYYASFDSDPCGGSCAAYGHTYISRCGNATIATTCYDGEATCFECNAATRVDDCTHGRAPPGPLATAEAKRRALFGPRPTMLGPEFGPLVLGAPYSTWTSTADTAARTAIESGGIVDLSERTKGPPISAATIDIIAMRFAGPCSRIRSELVAAWGATTNDRWGDASAHRRATLDPDGCWLSVERYVDPEQWAARDLFAPFPLVAPGTPLKAWLAATGGAISDDRPRHRATGIAGGRGPITVHATDTRGRVTAWETAFEPIDDASYARLRDHLTMVLGTKPVDRDGGLTWKGKPTVTLSASTGEFRLSAD